MLGDIDADAIEVSATDEDGNPVPAAGLGFEGVFNYCDASPRPSSVCAGGPRPATRASTGPWPRARHPRSR